MERRNGSDPLAPPRPPKLLPRVHRPRAPDPTVTSTQSSTDTNASNNNIINGSLNSGSSSSSSSSRNYQHINNRNQQHFHSINFAKNSQNSNETNRNVFGDLSKTVSHYQSNSIDTPIRAAQINQSNTTPTTPATAVNLSCNNNFNNPASLSPAITATNSFTRRRPLPPASPSPSTLTPRTVSTPSPTLTAAVPLLTVINGNILTNSFPQNLEVPASPVTLAAPRPESDRLTNEYVDTPLCTTQQLHHASRTQHPAGESVFDQTTTQHSLLLQRSQLRSQDNRQQHTIRVETAGSATTSIAPVHEWRDGTSCTSDNICCNRAEAFIHSNTKTTSTTGKSAVSKGKEHGLGIHQASSPTPPYSLNSAIPATQSIVTKQPVVTSSTISPNSFIKDPHQNRFHDDICDLHHHDSLSIMSSPGAGSHSNVNESMINSSIMSGGIDAAQLNPITCPRCERCRCEQCQTPRQLPQTWICNKTCLCSAETIIDYASCLCCVKALFYHCGKDHEMDCEDGATTLCVDDPCTCLPHKRIQRWGWLSALSLLLPCLWCYWPMRGCAIVCEKCYGRFAGHGCRCQQIGSTSSMLPIVPLGSIGSGRDGGNGRRSISGDNLSKATGRINSNHHHHHHHQLHHSHHQKHNNECSATNRILRKSDLTPEKRLLSSTPEF